METTSLNASKALAFLSNFTSLFKPATLSVSANASMLNKAFSQSNRVYTQVGSAVQPHSVTLDYVVGEFKQGGVVIWVTEDGKHGLVASIVNLGPTTGPDAYTLKWGPVNDITKAIYNQPLPKSYTNPIPEENYSGYQNQKKILELDPDLSDYPAFAACKNYSITIAGTTYDDWFLPTLTELKQIYNQRVNVNRASLTNGGQALKTDHGSAYWSSFEAENDFGVAWLQNFFDGYQNGDIKSQPYPVRCVRAF